MIPDREVDGMWIPDSLQILVLLTCDPRVGLAFLLAPSSKRTTDITRTNGTHKWASPFLIKNLVSQVKAPNIAQTN